MGLTGQEKILQDRGGYKWTGAVITGQEKITGQKWIKPTGDDITGHERL